MILSILIKRDGGWTPLIKYRFFINQLTVEPYEAHDCPLLGGVIWAHVVVVPNFSRIGSAGSFYISCNLFMNLAV